MSDKVSVNTEIPSPYLETNNRLYRWKRKLTYAFAFRLLHRFLDKSQPLRILEIGTGAGFFLDFARDNFPAGQFTGLEYDTRLLRAAAMRAPFAKLVQGNAENFQLGFHQFDVVVSFQVIEHLFNPDAMLQNIKAHLRPGGIVLLTTPNLAGLGAKFMKTRWHGFRDDHVSLKGMSEWVAMMKNHGFKELYAGSTFFSGIPILNRLPLGLFNWLLLTIFGSLRWSKGESVVLVFQHSQ